ncbi:MAG: hypothetical protein Q9205_007579 [Flavoplaca limonia]
MEEWAKASYRVTNDTKARDNYEKLKAAMKDYMLQCNVQKFIKNALDYQEAKVRFCQEDKEVFKAALNERLMDKNFVRAIWAEHEFHKLLEKNGSMKKVVAISMAALTGDEMDD